MTAVRHDPRRKVPASSVKASAIPNSPTMIYYGVKENMRQPLYCHQWIFRAISS